MGALEFLILFCIGYTSGMGVTSGFFFQLISTYFVRGKEPWREYAWLAAVIPNTLLIGHGVVLITVLVIFDRGDDWLQAAIPFLIGLACSFVSSILLAHFAFQGITARESELRTASAATEKPTKA